MMKKISLFLLMIASCYYSLAQETEIVDSLTETPMEQFKFITENLDLSEVTSGLILDKGFKMIPVENFTGQTMNDSNVASAVMFAKMYVSLTSSAIDEVFELPHASSYTTKMNEMDESMTYLGGIHYDYHKLKPEVLSSNLMYINNGQLFDIIPRSSSPYSESAAFLVTPMKLKLNTFTPTFIFRSDLFYTNTNKTIDQIEVDFGDGLGYRVISQNVPVQVVYEANGLIYLKTRIVYSDASIFYSHAVMEISVFEDQKSYNTTFLTETIESSTSHNGEFGSAEITVLLGCGHTDIQKPLIWVEGYNPPILDALGQNLDKDYMLAILNYQVGPPPTVPLRFFLEREGYDLVYVDFADGGDWIEKNGYVVQDVIRWVNQRKLENGSSEQNVVIGESMGGLVAKFALRKMELNPEDHQTKIYISLDSPHQGANIPLCGQFAARHIPYIYVGPDQLYEHFNASAFNEVDLRLGEWMLETRAAKQMLIYQAPENFDNQTGTSLTASEHTNFYSMYQNLGDLENCLELKSSNGSVNGVLGGQGFNPGDELVKIDFDNSDISNYWISSINGQFNGPFGTLGSTGAQVGIHLTEFTSYLILQGFVNFRLNALPNYSSDNFRIYKGHFSVNLVGLPINWSHKTVKVKNVYPYDSSPGGFFDIPVTLDPTSSPALQLALSNGNIAVNLVSYNYIPTFSALDLPDPYKINPYAALSSVNLNSRVLTNTSSSYPNLFGNSVMLNNTLHIRFYQRNALWLLYHLTGSDNINDNVVLSSGSYNFGQGNVSDINNFENTPFQVTTTKIDNLSQITNTAQVFVNKNNRIGFIATDNAPYTFLGTFSNPTNFIVHVKPECNQSTKTLLINNNGLLYIGENQYQTGELHIHDGATVIVGNGGDLYVKENSKIIVHPGGKLVIEDGGELYNSGLVQILGKYNVDDNTWDTGIFQYEDGGSVKLVEDNSEIQFKGGDLQIGQDATFTFSGDGQLRFSSWGPHIYGESNSQFLLNGDGINDPILVIDQDADLWSNSAELDWIGIHNGEVQFFSNSRLVSIQPFFSNKVHYNGLELNRGLVTYDNSTIANALFDEVPIYAPLFYKATGTFNMVLSEINNTTANSVVKIKGMGYNISSCEFNGSALYLLDGQNTTQYSTVLNCEFNGDLSTVGMIDNSSAEVEVRKCTFNTLYAGVHKLNGKLNIKCNSFINFKYAGAIAHGNCLLDMSSLSHGGYNIFQKNSPIVGTNVALWNAQYIYLGYGYNYFDEQGNLPIIQGTLAIGYPPLWKQHIQAKRNQWNAANTAPLTTDISITSYITGNAITAITSQPQSAACPPTDIISTDVASLAPSGVNGAEKITTTNFNDIKLVDAIDQIITESERYNDIKNDLIALALFEEVLTYDFDKNNSANMWLIDFAYNYMRLTLQHTFRTGKICRGDNAVCFHPGVQNYVNVLNALTSEQLSEDNYEKMFYLEMDKVHLFHQLGKYDLALMLLYNMESCGLDFEEQKHVNHWKFELETEFAKINSGFEAEFKDTNWVDTTYYLVPTHQPFGNFGSEIINLSTIEFFNCSNPKSMISNDSDIDFSVYPNPSTGVYNVTYNLPEGSQGQVVIYSSDGRELFRFNCQSGSRYEEIDITGASSGTYLYTYVIDGVVVKSGNLILN